MTDRQTMYRLNVYMPIFSENLSFLSLIAAEKFLSHTDYAIKKHLPLKHDGRILDKCFNKILLNFVSTAQ